MDQTNTIKNINKEVNITAWYFKRRQKMVSYPRRMEFDHQEYVFAEGLRYLVQKGKSVVQLFDMTDGQQNFRLRFDGNDQNWTLVSITGAR